MPQAESTNVTASTHLVRRKALHPGICTPRRNAVTQKLTDQACHSPSASRLYAMPCTRPAGSTLHPLSKPNKTQTKPIKTRQPTSISDERPTAPKLPHNPPPLPPPACPTLLPASTSTADAPQTESAALVSKIVKRPLFLGCNTPESALARPPPSLASGPHATLVAALVTRPTLSCLPS